MKKLKWIVLGLAVLVVVALLGVWMNLNRIVRSTVQTQSTRSLGVSTTLGGASVSLFGGNVALDDLQIASPEGFQAPRMFTLDGIHVDTSLGQFTKDPVHIQSIHIDKPHLVLEQSGGKLNLQALMDQMPQAPDEKPTEPAGEPIKVIINSLKMTGADVTIRPGIPGLAEQVTVTIPPIELANIGTGEGAQNGVAIKEVVMQLGTAMAAKAAESEQLPPEVRRLLSLNVGQVAPQLTAEFNKQVGQISATVQQAAQDILKDPAKAQDAAKQVQQQIQGQGKELQEGIRGLIGGKDKDREKDKDRDKDEKRSDAKKQTSQPTTRRK